MIKNFEDYFSYSYIFLEKKLNLILLIENKIELKNIKNLEINKERLILTLNNNEIIIKNNEDFYNNFLKFKSFLIFKKSDYKLVNKDLKENDKIEYLTFLL